jgi:chemotaxis family two-component system response regulator Rcp1
MNEIIFNSSIDVLLVEHNFDNSYRIQEFFKEKRIINRVHTVRDGIEAIDFFRNEGIFSNCFYTCLLMIDLNVPYCREVFEEITRNVDLNNVPLILITDLNENELIKLYNLPAKYYIVKPVDVNKCIDLISYEGSVSSTLKPGKNLFGRKYSYLM